MHLKLGSAILSQPAFPGESNPNFPQEKSPRNNTVNKTKQSKKEQQRKKTSELENCYQMNVKARKIYELIGAMWFSSSNLKLRQEYAHGWPDRQNRKFTSGMSLCFRHRSGELRTQKLKPHLVRTQSLKVLPLKPGESQYIAIHATLTARDFFLPYFYPSGPFTCFFSKTSPDFFFPVLAMANTGSCVGPQNKIGHPAWCRFPCWAPTEYKYAKE